MLWRQGDVFIETVERIPEEARRRSSLVLIEGELTGHSHRIADRESAELLMRGEEMFLKVSADEAQIVHQEHGTIRLPRGTYRVWRQREYVPQKSNPPVPPGSVDMRRQEVSFRWVTD